MTADYYQLLSKMIETAKADASARRTYVYELTRIQLLRHASTQTPPWSNTRILHELQELDRAVAKVESDIASGAAIEVPLAPDLPLGETSLPLAETPDGPVIGPVTGAPDGAAAETAPAAEAQAASPPDTDTPEAAPRQAWTARLRPRGLWFGLFTLGGLGLIAGAFLWRPAPPVAPAPAERAATAPEVAPTPAPRPEEPSRSGIRLPETYGVFALRNGQLIELTNTLPRLPGRGGGTEAAIVEPSRQRFPDGRMSFVVRDRVFINGVPPRIAVGVVARIAREFVVDKGRRVTTPLSGLWVLRSVGSEYRVDRLDDRQDTVLVQPDPPEASLPPGRYALLFNEMAYDFLIEGNVTDPVHCVERTATASDDTYEQCPTR